MASTSSTSAEIGYQAPVVPVNSPQTVFTPVLIVDSGLLSQTVRNLQASIQQLAALTGLPLEAQTKKNLAVRSLEDEIKKILATQSAVKQFVTDTLASLQQAKTDLDAGTNLDHVVSIITRTSALATALKQSIDALSADLNATRSQINDFSTSLAPIRSQIQHVQTILSAQIQAIADELKNPWATLGDVLTGRMNKLKAEATNMGAQITFMDSYIHSVDLMITDFSYLLNQVCFVGNAVNFLASEDSGVINDLRSTQGGRLKARLYLMTAINQVQTLETDAA